MSSACDWNRSEGVTGKPKEPGMAVVFSGAADWHLRQGKEEKAQLIKKPNQFKNWDQKMCIIVQPTD